MSQIMVKGPVRPDGPGEFAFTRFLVALDAIGAVVQRALASGKYPKGETWRAVPAIEHARRAHGHLEKWLRGDSEEPHLQHAATRALMALTNYMVGDRRQPEPAAENTPSRCCWRCGAAGTPPPPSAQIAVHRQIQEGRPPVFAWTWEELQRLEAQMEFGDIILNMSIQSAEVKRVADGSIYTFWRTDA